MAFFLLPFSSCDRTGITSHGIASHRTAPHRTAVDSERSFVLPSNRAIGRPVSFRNIERDRPTDRPTDRRTSQPVDRASERVTDEPASQPASQPAKRADERKNAVTTNGHPHFSDLNFTFQGGCPQPRRTFSVSAKCQLHPLQRGVSFFYFCLQLSIRLFRPAGQIR